MSSEVLEMYETLTDVHKEEVDNFIRNISSKQEIPFKRDLSNFYGCISDEDAAIMLEASRECRKIDYGEW